MIYRRLESFHRDLQGLPEEIRQQAIEKFSLLQQNPQYPYHPSLRIKKMKGHTDIREGHVTMSIVFTFHKGVDVETGEETFFFRRIATHDVYDNP